MKEIVVVIAALLGCAPPILAQPELHHKKVIEYGWDVPSPDFVRTSIGDMEKRPFDGIVLRLRGGSNVFLRKPLDPVKLAPDMEDLRGIAWQHFTDNFVLMLAACDEGWDWFSDSDWQAAEHNVRLVSRAARAGKCTGICFDPEPYGANPWLYGKQPLAAQRSFADFQRQVRRRGAQFIRAIQDEMPHPRILTFFQLSLFGSFLDDADPAARESRLSQEGYGLLPAFLNGMLDGARPDTLIIDGNEPSYYYTASEPFYRVYHLMRQRALALVAPENRRKYALQVQAGQALYMDQLFGTREPANQFLSTVMTPEERARWFEHNAYYALYTTDEYVWCYSERMSWWKNQIPPGAEAALRSARRKIESGSPLGFSIDPTIRAAESRRTPNGGAR